MPAQTEITCTDNQCTYSCVSDFTNYGGQLNNLTCSNGEWTPTQPEIKCCSGKWVLYVFSLKLGSSCWSFIMVVVLLMSTNMEPYDFKSNAQKDVSMGQGRIFLMFLSILNFNQQYEENKQFSLKQVSERETLVM